MSDIIKLLEKGFENLSNPVLITFILIAVVFLYLTKSAWIAVIKKISIKELFTKKEKTNTIDSLKNHDVFNELDIAKTITDMKFMTHGKEDEIKSKIFKDFLDIKLIRTAETMLEIAEEATPDMERAELKRLVVQKFIQCNVKLEHKLKMVLVEKGLTIDMITEVIDKFFEIRKNTLERYDKRFDSIFGSDFYHNNYYLLLAVFEVVAFEVDNIVKESIETFNEVNGLFKDLPYDM